MAANAPTELVLSLGRNRTIPRDRRPVRIHRPGSAAAERAVGAPRARTSRHPLPAIPRGPAGQGRSTGLDTGLDQSEAVRAGRRRRTLQSNMLEDCGAAAALRPAASRAPSENAQTRAAAATARGASSETGRRQTEAGEGLSPPPPFPCGCRATRADPAPSNDSPLPPPPAWLRGCWAGGSDSDDTGVTLVSATVTDSARSVQRGNRILRHGSGAKDDPPPPQTRPPSTHPSPARRGGLRGLTGTPFRTLAPPPAGAGGGAQKRRRRGQGIRGGRRARPPNRRAGGNSTDESESARRERRGMQKARASSCRS